MRLRVVVGPFFKGDVSALPIGARTEMWRIVGRLRDRPFLSGVGYSVYPIRKTDRRGVRVTHFLRDQYRLLFEVDGELLILVGVGLRPGFYRRLDRLRARKHGMGA
jgi:hypothetical protein